MKSLNGDGVIRIRARHLREYSEKHLSVLDLCKSSGEFTIGAINVSVNSAIVKLHLQKKHMKVWCIAHLSKLSTLEPSR